jgi:hypothetical protein
MFGQFLFAEADEVIQLLGEVQEHGPGCLQIRKVKPQVVLR